MKHSALLALTALAALALTFAGGGCKKQHAPQQTAFTAGNANARIEITANHSDQLPILTATARRALNSVWADFNPTNRAGEINKINRMGSEYRLQISFNTFRGLDLADYYGRLANGAYDVTLGPLREAWGLGGTPPDEPPMEEELAALKNIVGTDHVQLAEQGAISILTPGTRLTPGDLPYAYGTDLAILDIRSRELGSVLLSWGNFTRALSQSGDTFSAQVALQNPFNKTNDLGRVDLAPDAALATADLYKESVTIAGTRYGGILDPHTGHPATGTIFVAVRGPTCTMSHILAQSLIVLGREKGEEILTNFPDCEVLLIPDKRPLEIWLTPGFAEHLQINSNLVAEIKPWNTPQNKTKEGDAPSSQQQENLDTAGPV